MAPLHLSASFSSSSNTSPSCGAQPLSPNASRAVVTQSSFQKSLQHNSNMSRDSLIIRVLALLVALMILGVQHQRYHQQQKQQATTSSLASHSTSSSKALLLLDPLLQEPPAIAPWDNPSSDSLAFAKVMAEHPLMVLDVVLIVGLHTSTSTTSLAATRTTRWVLHQQRQQTEFLRRAMTWWWAKRTTTTHRQASSILRRFSVVLAKALKRTLKGTFKTIQRLYKNRSKYSTLSDYTWYVNTTTNTTSATSAKGKQPTMTTRY